MQQTLGEPKRATATDRGIFMHEPDTKRHPSEGPHSSDKATKGDDLDFDPDSPDLEDPQVDPVGPAKAPLDDDTKP